MSIDCNEKDGITTKETSKVRTNQMKLVEKTTIR